VTLLSTSDLLKAGWNSSLIRKLLGEPDEREEIKRGIYSCTRYWYTQARVTAATSDPAFLALQERRKARRLAPERRRSGFEGRYQMWRGALPDACRFMHSLNRYAKHQACSVTQRDEIYGLKNGLVELLYRAGYCTACWIHEQVLPAKVCFECGGSGDGGACDRCDGSGHYLPAKTLRFYVFRFALGRGYTWHQPDRLVKFPVETTREPEEWAGVEREKPIALNRSQFAAAKDLVRWVIEKGTGAAPEPVIEHEWEETQTSVDWRQEALF
jgi:hypothetical protein